MDLKHESLNDRDLLLHTGGAGEIKQEWEMNTYREKILMRECMARKPHHMTQAVVFSNFFNLIL